jgi:23S rRNA pseudouridine1911/1915/1917 synthase
MSQSPQQHNLTVTDGGDRLDRYLGENVPGLSRTHAQELIHAGHVRVNGLTAKASLKLSAGDEVTVTVPPETTPDLQPESIPLDLLYEDGDVLVVNKPAGMTVHPAPGNEEHTLVNAVLARITEMPDDTGRPGIVHRLDKDTSGVMVIARSRQALAALSDQFKERTVVKTYLVLVRGRVTPQQGVIEAPIGRDAHDRQRMAIIERGRPSRTEYRVARYVGPFTLLEVKPETGRTHQIRVHLAAIGHPVAGDTTYGVKAPPLTRQFVHAWKLRFRLPSSNQEVEFSASLPAELQAALEALG